MSGGIHDVPYGIFDDPPDPLDPFLLSDEEYAKLDFSKRWKTDKDLPYSQKDLEEGAEPGELERWAKPGELDSPPEPEPSRDDA